MKIPALPAYVLATVASVPSSLWILGQELLVRSKGEHLSADLLAWAHRSGIERPEEIRVHQVNEIPFPLPLGVQKYLDRLGFPTRSTAGICARRGILLKKGLFDPEAVLKHELIHTRQYQESGSVFLFLVRYLSQCLIEGYHDSPLEKDARQSAESH